MTKRFDWSGVPERFLRMAYADHPTSEIARILGITERQVYAKAHQLGLNKSADYIATHQSGQLTGHHPRSIAKRFKKGQEPWNKGMKGIQPGGRAKETQFKPGHRPQTWRPIGSERLMDGYLQRKVTDTGYPPRDWVGVHILLWREHHGEIPDGHVVTFLDGDRTNVCIENLVLLSRRELCWLNKNGFAAVPPEARPAAIALARVRLKVADRSRGAARA